MRSDTDNQATSHSVDGASSAFLSGDGFGHLDTPTAKKRRRITQKLILLYFIPVSVLVIAGVGVPLLLWSSLGGTIREHDAVMHFAEQAEGLQKAAIRTENLYRAYIVSREPTRVNARKQIQDARQEYGMELSLLEDFIDNRNIEPLRELLVVADDSFQLWNRSYVDKELAQSQRPLFTPSHRSGTTPEFQASLSRVAFVSVQRNLALFVKAAQAQRDGMDTQAQYADLLRNLSVILFPLGAFLLSALIGRSIAISITGPLEDLTRASEELEQGGTVALLNTDAYRKPPSDDEIGELTQSFMRMARTIGQREAMLRAQNEALGALNQRIESVLNATNDAILMLDRSGAFSVVNQRFEELFGIEADVLLDQTFVQAAPLLLSRFRKRQEVRDRLERLLSDPQDVADEVFEVGEPTPRVLRMFSAPVRGEHSHHADAAIIGRILVFRDVTRETMVDRMKTEFVSTVSHELRTPLTAIKGYVDLMVSGQTGSMNEVQTEFLTMVQGSTKRLTALINDLLDISRIESGRIDIKQESVDYLPLVGEAIRMMSGEAEAKEVRLALETSGDIEQATPVYGDADRITQVLVNFLSNGIKYTPAGGTVTVSVEYADNIVTTCIADTGIGITREDQNRLFQKFFRADNSTTRETGGTGLGLAITKAILEKLGGSVWVDSVVGKGSKFWFTLPTVDSDGASGDSETHHLVLNIDSDTTLLHRMGHELRLQGFVTSNAANMTEARRRARGLHPDLITLDILANGFNGVEILRSLQKDTATADIPIVLMSMQNIGGRLEAVDSIRYLPLRLPDNELATAIKANLSPLRSRREIVLVVGDAEVVAQARRVLSSRGEAIRIMVASNSEEAMDRIAESFPDLTLIDTSVPEIEVGSITARLRERRPNERVPIIALLDPELLTVDVSFLPNTGMGPIALSRLGVHLRRVLTAGRNPAVPISPTEQDTRTEVIAA